jgi:hypothetical protein
MSQSTDEIKTFPIHLVLHGRVKYTKPLVDIDGNWIPSWSGYKLTLVDPQAKHMLETKQIRCLYNIRDGYRYFITCESQLARFRDHRDRGSPYPLAQYHIYQDDDY